MPDVRRETAMRLAVANQALHDAWPYMDVEKWTVAINAVQASLVAAGLPVDLRPSYVDDALSRQTNQQ